MSNPTNTAKTDALKAERLHAFITLAKVSPLAIANVLANVIDALDKSEAKVADLLGTLDGEIEETKALEKQKARLREELDKSEAKVTDLSETLAKEVDANDALWETVARLRMELDDVHAKRGALLREVADLKQNNAALTMRLREAEAALGVPCNDEWDSWSDAAMAQGLDASATLFNREAQHPDPKVIPLHAYEGA